MKLRKTATLLVCWLWAATGVWAQRVSGERRKKTIEGFISNEALNTDNLFTKEF